MVKSHHNDRRARLYDIIYESDTPAGKLFDLVLIYSIVFSVIIVMLDSVDHYRANYGQYFNYLEWTFTGIFIVEYTLRIYCNEKPHKYIFSFYGIIDFLAILPAFIAPFITDANYLIIVRILRILRVFRILKLGNYVTQANLLTRALISARQKITVFMLAVTGLVVIFGSIMYMIEGPEHGFTSIPKGIYWAIVTLTTVGYGDVTPQTFLGQTIAAGIMIMGYSIIAVPTGIFTAELAQAINAHGDSRECAECGKKGHRVQAFYCDHCGHGL